VCDRAIRPLANFHPTEILADVRVFIPEHALGWLEAEEALVHRFSTMLGFGGTLVASRPELPVTGLSVGDLEPFAVRFYSLG
jgi:hypothetical protein